MKSEKRYYRARGIAEYLIEGHTLAQARDEFKVSDSTIERDLEFLAGYGYNNELDDNIKLYKKAKIQLYRNRHSKK